MPSRIREARWTRRGGAGESILTGLFSLAAARFPWTRETPRPRREAVARSSLASLFSLAAAQFPWIRSRHGDLKAAVMAALAHVDHYEDRDTRRPVAPDAPGARSVGLSYREIQRRVRARYPGGRTISILTIRSYARDAREEGREMPYRRPNSTRRRGTGFRERDA